MYVCPKKYVNNQQSVPAQQHSSFLFVFYSNHLYSCRQYISPYNCLFSIKVVRCAPHTCIYFDVCCTICVNFLQSYVFIALVIPIHRFMSWRSNWRNSRFLITGGNLEFIWAEPHKDISYENCRMNIILTRLFSFFYLFNISYDFT